MKQATRDRLNALNLRFYGEQADAFSATRARPWPGFARALEHAAHVLLPESPHAPRTVRVLDVGCGNGRLIEPLRERFAERLAYTGIDASEPLLAIAGARYPQVQARFARADFVAVTPERALPEGPFDLVALFGVLHHVPGEVERRAMIRVAAARVAPGGVLAFTLWRFDESSRFAGRCLDQHAREALARALAFDADQLEPGDQLLRWGQADAGVRYCHFCDEAEIERLNAAAALAPLARFRSDGESDRLNDYVLLRAAR
jgi:2-polyprenyl-3-methyl-5-hydroxy-6-metoxy-1,4-benzoquinol methylase